MSGKNNGTGRPNFFRCSQCRKHSGRLNAKRPTCTQEAHARDGQHCGYGATLTLHMRRSAGQIGLRCSPYTYQYRCACCEHVGWSKHTDLERKAVEAGLIVVDRSSGFKCVLIAPKVK